MPIGARMKMVSKSIGGNAFMEVVQPFVRIKIGTFTVLYCPLRHHMLADKVTGV